MNAGASSRGVLIGLLALIVLVAIVVAAWHSRNRESSPQAVTATTVPARPIDASNEGRIVAVSGQLDIGQPARDTELGVSANALVLVREVEMFQWYEDCAAAGCRYDRKWSAQPIDSTAFRETAGHANPGRFPFAAARFEAGAVRLGDFDVDAGFAARGRATTDLAVGIDELPPNLAATFRESGGLLYAGADPEHPGVGDLRVSYRAVPTGVAHLVGVQRGRQLLPLTSEPDVEPGSAD